MEKKRPWIRPANCTMCVTAIRWKPPRVLEACKQSPRAFPTMIASSWLGSSSTPPSPLSNYQNKCRAGRFNCLSAPLQNPIFEEHPPLLPAHCVEKAPCSMLKKTDLREMTLHQKSIYSWFFFTLPQKCIWCCTVCTSHFSEHLTHPNNISQ